MIAWMWMVGAIIFEVGATLSLRVSDGFRKRLWIVPIVLGYTAAFGFLGLSLSAGMSVGVAYGVWSAIGLILIALLSRAIWGEPLTRRMLIAIGLLVVGVLLVELGQP